ncbi:hypothetical protein EU527_14035 [Candidatus Thorarchaeota archaeon]|nr:MAG: hypothetical protein EU527_14035 [Candidatus Thorarchaeota archaeon]
MSDEVVNNSIPILRKNLDLTEIEVKVVVPIFLGGNMTAGGIALLSGEKLPSVKRALTRLITKGMVKEIPGIVPVYRALSPSLALSDKLAEALNDVQGLTGESEKALTSRIEGSDNVIETLLNQQKNVLDDIKTSLSGYEEKVINLVQAQIEQVVATSTSAMTGFSEEIEKAMNELDTTLDTNLGTKMQELHSEIDKAQIALDKDLSRSVKEFDKWLKQERKGAISSVGEFESKSEALVKFAKNAITKALTTSNESIQKIARNISGTLTSLASNASDSGVAVINNVSAEISQLLNNLDTELEQAYLTGQESLNEVITQSREISVEYGEFAKTRIDEAIEIIDSVGSIVDEWKSEVSGLMDVASQSVTSQLNQVSITDTNYLEVMKNSLTSHIERINNTLDDEYTSLKSLATTLGTECENNLGETRALILDLLQSQNHEEQISCDAAGKTLSTELDKWVGNTISSIDTKLNQTSSDISEILDTEISELNTISDAMNSRLKSAFNSVIKSTTTKNETLITSVKKTTHDFESAVGTRLEELITSFTTATEKQIRDAKELYEGLRDRLDNRMSKSVSTINSQADRIQKEITNSISEQENRLEQHTQAIREEFHQRLEDIINQFLSLSKGLEATFNGLLSSQTVEAREIIASAHSEFRTSLKNEVLTLKEDSQKLQQEYSTELALKIDEVGSSVETARKALEELSVQKRVEISESMAQTLGTLESSVRSTEQNLRDLESGTVNQFIENMEQVSQEFKVTADGARDNIIERLDTVRAITAESLNRSATAAKSAADTFIDAQKDLKQRFVADSSKKMNRLATKRAKSSATIIETFQSQLSDNQTSGVKDRSVAKDEILAAVETRRSEVANAFDAASAWIDSTMSNVSGSLDAHGSKLKNELTMMEKGLQKSAVEAKAEIQERGELDVDRLHEIASALLENTQTIITDRLNEFGDSCANALTKGNESFTQMPTKLGEELSEMETKISEEITKDYSTVSGDLATSFTECLRSSESASEGFKNLIENTSIQLTQKRDEIAEEFKKNTELSNQHASRKFEMIGLALKTQLSSDTSRLVEDARTAFTAQNLEITNAVTKTTNIINEETSSLRQIRNEALSSFGNSSEKSLKRWSSEQKEDLKSIQERLLASISGVTDQTKSTIEVLQAIHQLGDEILSAPRERTWYLSGTEEACAHIMDMAERAEDSIIISLTNLSCIDTKKLAKVKAPKRKVLIIPEEEEPISLSEALEGWRIWETKTPMLLSIVDEKEILVGGATDTEALVALVSEDASYLRLFHDLLGPRLINSRRSTQK